MEHRRHNRIPLVTPLIVLARPDNLHIGYVGDISEEGVLLILQNPLEMGQAMDIRIHLPAGSAYSHCDAQVEARWHQTNINPDLQCVGCLFKAIDAAELAELVHIADAIREKFPVKLNWIGRPQPSQSR